MVDGEPRFFNTVCLASPTGEIAVHYRKNHLWDYVDGSWACRGQGPGTCDTEFGRIGIGGSMSIGGYRRSPWFFQSFFFFVFLSHF